MRDYIFYKNNFGSQCLLICCLRSIGTLCQKISLTVCPLILANIMGISSSNFPSAIYTQLKSNSNSWKLYTLASFYWRYKGNAKEAIGNFEILLEINAN